MSTPTVISLFSGAGGMDYGLEAAGMQTAVCVEMDAHCCQTLRASRPEWQVIERDLFQVPSDALISASGKARGDIDLVVGGPPCQPFSKSGYWHRGDALRLGDPRANTLSAYLRVIEDTLPRAFILENVEGLAFNGKDEGLRLLQQGFEAINQRQGTAYRLSINVLNAASFGVPQNRERVFLVGDREGRSFVFPAATHQDATERLGEGLFRRLEPYRTAWDALGDLDHLEHPTLAVRGKWADLLPSIPEGQNYLWHTARGGGRPLFGWRRRYWTFLLKLSKDRPSWTLQAQPGPSVGPFHWRNRRLSAQELARLQTFPDDVRFAGPHAAVHKQLGNAVASLVTEVLGRAIRVQLLGLAPLDAPLRLLPLRRGPPPAPEPVLPVPPRFLALEGAHEAHPGTGLGHLAARRSAGVDTDPSV